MKNTSYTLKLSPQGQLTLPKELRERLHVLPGSRVVVAATGSGGLKLSGDYPIERHFGTMPGAWTAKGQDAAEYTRGLRETMQPKPDRQP